VGCLGPAAIPYALPTGEPITVLYVVRHGWHTRIAVRHADVDPVLWPESRDLGTVTWLEVGWGDRDYYPKPHASIWDAIDTVIRPTPAAIHVGGFDRAPPASLADAPMVCILVSARGLDRLAQFIHDSYELQNGPRPHSAGHLRAQLVLSRGRPVPRIVQQQQHVGSQRTPSGWRSSGALLGCDRQQRTLAG
jgi:Protein of unknown function (DUF2459)